MPTLRPTKNAKTNRAFSLVEILVVIAITAVLFTLLLGPLVKSFQLTQSAQMQVAAQDAARRTSEIVSRELGSAAYVFSNTTHPFQDISPSSVASIPDVRFSNFLVLTVPKNTNGTLTTAPAVAFNAKLDFVLPHHNAANAVIDPTTQEPITIKNGAAAPTGLTFPLAPGTTMIRYFIGLRQPFKTDATGAVIANPYATQGEGSLLAGSGNNTYVLYRAQFTPTYLDSNNKPTANPVDGTTVNSNLFASKLDANNNPTNTPEFDDPDFFRFVTTTDPNWLDPNHNPYTAAQATAHNARLQNWFQIAKPVISSPNIDLILLPHNADNTLNYDTASTYTNVVGVAHSGIVHDPATMSQNKEWPVVNTSVTFKFASVSADATANTTADNAAQGVGANAADANSGLPYIPAVYTATDRSWASPYHITLSQYNDDAAPLFDTTVQTTSDTGTTPKYQAGDLIETMYSASAGPVPVFDVSSGAPLVTNGDYVPMTVTPDTGTISFDMPALPTPGSMYDRYFQVPVSAVAAGNGYLDLSTLVNSAGAATSPLPSVPLDPTATVPALTPSQVANARIVPGSVRVYGPDAFPGPDQPANGGLPQQVLYSAVYPGDAAGPQANQYEVDYAHNALRLNVGNLAAYPTAPIRIAFDYQANLAPAAPVSGSSPNPVIAAGNPAYPLQVKVDYQTRDLLDVNMGVRVYDPNNVGPAQIVTVHNQVRIGNSNR